MIMYKKSAVEILHTICVGAQKPEKILYVSDDPSAEIADLMWHSSAHYPNRALIRMADRIMHGDEPPDTVAAAMAQADIIFGITKFSMYHSAARRNAVANGARFANMADYNIEMMHEGGLFVDFEKQGAWMDRFSDALDGSETIRITTALGTDIKASIKGRMAVRQYGRSLKTGSSSSPPDIETAIGPIEGSVNGTAVIDGSIPFPGLGVLSEKIRLTIKAGAIVDIEGGNQAAFLKKSLSGFQDPAVYQMAEIGFGFNDHSVLRNRMLEDEGVMGTIHFGFGNSLAFGGSIDSSNHIDMVFTAPSVWADDKQLLDDGQYLIK